MLLNSAVGEDSWDPLDCKEIQSVNPKGNQSWMFIGRTDVEAETPILWPPDAKSWLIGKDPDDGKDCRQEENGTTEDEMIGWHHWLNGHEFDWVNSGSWWWTGKPVVFQSMGLQRVEHVWSTEPNWMTREVGHFQYVHWPFGYFASQKCLFKSFICFTVGFSSFSQLYVTYVKIYNGHESFADMFM